MSTEEGYNGLRVSFSWWGASKGSFRWRKCVSGICMSDSSLPVVKLSLLTVSLHENLGSHWKMTSPMAFCVRMTERVSSWHQRRDFLILKLGIEISWGPLPLMVWCILAIKGLLKGLLLIWCPDQRFRPNIDTTLLLNVQVWLFLL